MIKRNIIGVIIIIALMAFLSISGMFQGLFQLMEDPIENGTTTQTKNIAGINGNTGRELLDAKGYILSYKNDGHSEKIICSGSVKWDSWSMADVDAYRYIVYLKKNSWSSYEVMSKPGTTSKYISNPNPGIIKDNYIGGTEGSGQIFTITPYQFTIIGNDYSDGAIKVEFQAKIKRNQLDPFGSWEWKTIQSDEAYLYSGYGGLYLPRGLEDNVDRPYSTFEIGQTVRIGVETAKGGYTEGNSLPWRVTLNRPYTGIDSKEDTEILGDDPTRYGSVIKEQFFPNDCEPSNTFFEFTVTEEMAKLSMESDAPFTIRLWNVLLPKGTLQIDFVDFLFLCPAEVTFEGPEKAKVGEPIYIKLYADINSETQAEIDYFRVSVIYGTGDVLLPSDWSSKLWVIHTTNVGYADKNPCNIPQTISFTSDREGYVTVHAKAVDIQGRASKITKRFTLYTWEKEEPPDETIDDEVGEGDYGGGHTPGWTPWDPAGGNWEDTNDITNWTKLIISLVIFFVFLIISLLPHIPIPMGWIGRFLLISAGVVIAVLFYLFVDI